MSRKAKIIPEVKIKEVEDYLDGKTSVLDISRKLFVDKSTVRSWIRNYRAEGSGGLMNKSYNKSYSKEFKIQAVNDYLDGKGSLKAISQKYRIKSHETLRRWIMKYNGHDIIKSSSTGRTTIMTKGRKTSFEERIAIVEYCTKHNHDYNSTAKEFQISYQQARNYTIKYETKGIDGLMDRRGRSKPEDEMNEVEKLRAQNKLLKAQKERAEMELSFLKKLEEIERRRG